jgi:hypothetical protein
MNTYWNKLKEYNEVIALKVEKISKRVEVGNVK